MKDVPHHTRRQWFARVVAPGRSCETYGGAQSAAITASAPAQRIAVIQGRYCLAYRNLVCTTCVEKCPVPGAIELAGAIPRVNPSVCTGCSDCHAACPAPQNAILMVGSRGEEFSHRRSLS